jgi:hypothetical protein
MLLFPFWNAPDYYNPTPRNPLLDTNFDCYGYDRLGNPYRGVGVITIDGNGIWLNKTIFASPGEITVSSYGNIGFWRAVASPGVVIISGEVASFGGYVPFAAGGKTNWVKWSNIGSLNFTIGKDNVAGERPLDCKGTVYAIKKLGNKAVAYGENGVSFLVPAGAAYGLNTVYRIGLKSKNAVAGDETKHFFIDKAGQLWKVGESLDKLDYSEYLSLMNNNLVMSYDNLNNLIYICDGSVGYVYSPNSNSLGECQANITGMGWQGGTLFVVAPAAIVTDPFKLCTDIYDMGTRKNKTIYSLDFGVDLSNSLYVAIDYRRSINGSFSTTPWMIGSPKGHVNIIAFGLEFRIRAKTLTYEWFHPDYIKISGVVHDN